MLLEPTPSYTCISHKKNHEYEIAFPSRVRPQGMGRAIFLDSQYALQNPSWSSMWSCYKVKNLFQLHCTLSSIVLLVISSKCISFIFIAFPYSPGFTPCFSPFFCLFLFPSPFLLPDSTPTQPSSLGWCFFPQEHEPEEQYLLAN